jgi:PKD repeat protein
MTTLSVDVRTPVAKDVSTSSEFRWDIDGDGFYDVKTTTPSYQFKYTYPGEYNPKVKVTHKGISTTKSLTLVVKNSLVPKATMQIIGNKIIAYNTSAGIFQTVNWYLDDTKISENKDYLLYEID